MQRQKYFNYIQERLSTLASRIKSGGKLNVLDLNIHCENFYSDFLKLLYGYQLRNLNTSGNSSYEAIDLIDERNKIYAQVSATATKQKIESSLAKLSLDTYSNFTFKFILITDSDNGLKAKTYKNPSQINFDPATDIIDNSSILSDISQLEIDKMQQVYEFIQKELGHENKSKNLDSNLTAIINLLAKEDLSADCSFTTTSFHIEEKITYNQLGSSREIVENYKIHNSRVKKIYEVFDKEGFNKSLSVLSFIQREYLKLIEDNPDQVFHKIREELRKTVINSGNYEDMASEELDLCLDILLVDAFIRCKIFKNPQEDLNASP